MLYRVFVDMAFDDYDDAHDLWERAIDVAHKAIVINPDAINRESPKAHILECGHDEDPPTPCTIISRLYEPDS